MNPVSVFRWLLATSILLTLTGVISEFLTISMLPQSLQEFAALEWDLEEPHSEADPNDFLLMLFAIAVLGLVTAGYFGLFMLKIWGRICFVASGVVTYLILPFLGPSVLTGISYTLYDLATLSMGAIVAMAYLSPVRDHIEGSYQST